MEQTANPLSNLELAHPCTASWDAMKGDDRVRFCEQCQLSVYNLSAMNRNEAEAYARRHETERVCLRFYRRADGTVLTQDCPRGLQAARLTARRSLKRLVLFGVFLLALAFGGFMVAAGATRKAAADGSTRGPTALDRLWQTEPLKTVYEWLFPPPPWDEGGW